MEKVECDNFVKLYECVRIEMITQVRVFLDDIFIVFAKTQQQKVHTESNNMNRILLWV